MDFPIIDLLDDETCVGWLMEYLHPEEELIDQETVDLITKAVGIGARVLRAVLPSRLTREVMTQQFEVDGPTVVFVKANEAQISVRRRPGNMVKLDANLYVSAGLQIATQQDEAGIYIVILRKRVVGSLSRSNVRLTIPPDCDLVADLEGSNLHLKAVNGRITIPGVEA